MSEEATKDSKEGKEGEVREVERILTEKARRSQMEVEKWVPKTELGRMVKNGEITSMEQIEEHNMKIMEPEIIDMLMPDLQEKLVDFKKTTKVKRAGRQFSFRISVLVGDNNQYVGLGTAKDRERLPAIKKATRRAKLNLVKVRKGCGSWECVCGTHHSVPFKVEGKKASVRVSLLPAPKGTGLVVGDNIKDVMQFVGISDVWSHSRGNAPTKLNFVAAAVDALSKTTKMKLSKDLERKTTGSVL